MNDIALACERALAFVEGSATAFDAWLARTMISRSSPQTFRLPDGTRQRSDGSFVAVNSQGPEEDLNLVLRVLGALDDARALHLPETEAACVRVASIQSGDGSWGSSAMAEDERIYVTGMLTGHFAKTRFARASMLDAAADYLAERFSPERVQGFAWRPIAAYSHVFANVPHDAGDAVLQWTGRELERGFRSRRFDAVSTARVMLYCDAPALPGARLDAAEVIAHILEEQTADGGWLRPEEPAPEARVRHSLDALAAMVRFGGTAVARERQPGR